MSQFNKTAASALEIRLLNRLFIGDSMYDKEQLAQYGKKASDLFIKHAMPLSGAVREVTKGLDGFTDHHLKRVVENANLITFEELFKNGPTKHVEFELASFEDAKDYDDDDDEDDTLDPIPEEYTEKVPKPDSPIFDTPIEKKSAFDVIPEHLAVRETLHHIASAQSHLSEWLQRVDGDLEYETARLEQMCKKASLAEGGERPVLQLLVHVASDMNVFEKIATTIDTSYNSSYYDIGYYREMVPNLEHPICKQYSKVEGLVKEAKRLRGANIYLEDQRKKVLHTAKGL
jgi:hypothetical protein